MTQEDVAVDLQNKTQIYMRGDVFIFYIVRKIMSVSEIYQSMQIGKEKLWLVYGQPYCASKL